MRHKTCGANNPGACKYAHFCGCYIECMYDMDCDYQLPRNTTHTPLLVGKECEE